MHAGHTIKAAREKKPARASLPHKCDEFEMNVRNQAIRVCK